MFVYFSYSKKTIVYHFEIAWEMGRHFQNLVFEMHTYRKVASSRLYRLVAHSMIFRLFMKGKFDVYVLCPLAKRVQN